MYRAAVLMDVGHTRYRAAVLMDAEHSRKRRLQTADTDGTAQGLTAWGELKTPILHVLARPGVDWLVKCCFPSTETVGLLGTGAQDGHLHFHTPPEL